MRSTIIIHLFAGSLVVLLCDVVEAGGINVPADHPTIQAGIDAAVTGGIVLVAPGIYNEAINFMGKAITVLGTGGPAQTIIDASNLGTCAVRCINGEGTDTVLSGFQIVGGTGCNIAGPNSAGGGMLNLRSSPSVTNCTFRDNTAQRGGGMANVEFSSPLLTNCTFINNSGGRGGGIANLDNSNPMVTNCSFIDNNGSSGGGGIYNYNSSPTVAGCDFSGNTAKLGGGIYNKSNSDPSVTNCMFVSNIVTRGGGIYNEASSPTIADCTFSNNDARTAGGGIQNIFSSNPTIVGCTFINNTTQFGGGIINSETSSPSVTNCTFIGNTATANGGGLYNQDSSNPTVTNCAFYGNTADFGGGIANNLTASPRVSNCMFSGNMATQSGGGIVNGTSSNPTVTNCTFNGNTASIFGGGIENFQDSSPTVTNCLLWGNFPDEVFNHTDDAGISTPTFAYCDIGGSGGSAAWDPLLGTDGGNNIDADPLFVDPLGVDGLAGTEDDDLRLLPSSPAINKGDDAAVLLDVTTDLDGSPRFVCSVDMGAYENQTTAIHNTTTNTYFCTIQDCIDEADDSQACVIAPGTYSEAIDFLGKAITLRSSHGPAVTIIDATGAAASGEQVSVVRCANGETAETVLDGFTITGGMGDTTVFTDPSGGGMFNNFSSPTVMNCMFIGNTALGGFASGGGMLNSSASPTVTNCMFSGNTASFLGGGMVNDQSSSPTITNCTFSGNSATAGGAMFNSRSSNPTLTNCILHGNTPEEVVNNLSTPLIAYSDVAGSGGSALWDSSLGADGGGNIDADPLFRRNPDSVGGDYGDVRLTAGSPCIDAGSNADVPTGVTTDMESLARFVDDVLTANTGAGTPPIVDMGAYEFLAGDCNADGGVDLFDFADFKDCITGPGGGPGEPPCLCFDFDHNADIDLNDFGVLQLSFQGE